MISLEKTYNNAVWSLCAFDKIGAVRAKDLLTEYGSVSRVVEAIAVAPKNLTKIQGIGDVIAESLHKEVTAKWTN
jgi:ERCC4-type nuclease